MRILGISAFFHDSAAALLEDGRIVAAVQEERFTRRKHDASFPVHAIRYCLERAGGPTDAVVFYEKPLRKFERILRTAAETAPFGFRAFASAMPSWLREKLWLPLTIESHFAELGLEVAGKIFFASHHGAHAASAFYPSPFAQAAVLTLDGVGEWTTTQIADGDGNRLTPLREQHFPHSLGLLYSAFTQYCGFKVNSGEYKLMGLAPYGTPRYSQHIYEHLLDLRADGSFALNLDYFGFPYGQSTINRRFEQLFGGPARRPEGELTVHHCDLAHSIQDVTEEIVLRLARTAYELTGREALCLAGGVALNCVANGRLRREGPFREIWIQPAAGDAGGALGAALALHYQHFQVQRTPEPDAMQGAFLGPEYGEDIVAAALAELGITAEPLADEAFIDAIAQAVAAGEVVGHFYGRAEYGPRALGHRSILADARDPAMQRVLNLRIKQRESFRPFAPIVLEERATAYFEFAGSSPYMLLTAQVHADRLQSLPPASTDAPWHERLRQVRSDIPAVTHVDGSARLQTVNASQHPRLHAILSRFEALTGCAVMVNTSLNVRGEPPVCHPREALVAFLHTGMDCLAIGPYFLRKSTLGSVRLPPAPTFAPD